MVEGPASIQSEEGVLSREQIDGDARDNSTPLSHFNQAGDEEEKKSRMEIGKGGAIT